MFGLEYAYLCFSFFLILAINDISFVGTNKCYIYRLRITKTIAMFMPTSTSFCINIVLTFEKEMVAWGTTPYRALSSKKEHTIILYFLFDQEKPLEVAYTFEDIIIKLREHLTPGLSSNSVLVQHLWNESPTTL